MQDEPIRKDDVRKDEDVEAHWRRGKLNDEVESDDVRGVRHSDAEDEDVEAHWRRGK
jgi:hypothetical protein